MNQTQPQAPHGAFFGALQATVKPKVRSAISGELPSRAAAAGKFKRIGLFDHMGMGNMGDAAVHESFIQNLRKRLPDVELVSFSQNAADTEKRHKVESFSIRWYVPGSPSLQTVPAQPAGVYSGFKSWLRKYCPLLHRPAKRLFDFGRMLRHLKHSYHVVSSLDLLIMAGGGQLTDLWGDMPYNVWKFCVLAKLSKTPIYILGVGADQLKRPMSKRFASWAVYLADFCSFRDVESQDLIRRLGVKAETHVWPDPAYAVALPGPVHHHRVHDSKDKVGINPMGYCDPRLWPRKDEEAYNRYLDKMARVASRLLTQNYSIELFTSDIGVDKYALNDLKDRIRRLAPQHLHERVESRPVTDLDGLLAQMATFDYVITTKFHGVVFSHLLGKPVIALSYLPKIGYLMRSVGQQHYAMDIETFDSEELIERFTALAQESADLGPQLLKAAQARREALSIEFDTLFTA